MSFDGLVLTVLAVLAGIFVGLARGGRFRNIVGITVRAKGLLVVGMVVPAFADQFTREVAVPLVVGGLAALLAFAIVNVRIVGMSVMAVGIVANLLATFLNGGLPVSRDALVESGLATRAEVDRVELRGARRLEEPTHRLRFLGDIIPLEETSQVLAFGDLVILVGLADIAANLTLRKRKQARAVDASGAAAAPPADRAVAVIDLVRFHTPVGAHSPRPRPHGAPDAPSEPSIAAIGEHPAGSSPDVDWWPAARAADTAAAIDVVDVVAVDVFAVDDDVDIHTDVDVAADDPIVTAPLVPELLEEPVALIDLDVDEDLELADTDLADDTDLDDTDLADTAVAEVPDDDAADAPAAPPARRIDLDLDLRWAPDADDDIDLRDAPAEPQWSPEPQWAAEPERAREPEAGHGAAASAHVPGNGSIDDDLFQLLFADLSKPRRNRRHGERTIPDFEPVHVDDSIIPRGR